MSIITIEAFNSVCEWHRQQVIREELDKQERSNLISAIIRYCNAEAERGQ